MLELHTVFTRTPAGALGYVFAGGGEQSDDATPDKGSSPADTGGKSQEKKDLREMTIMEAFEDLDAEEKAEAKHVLDRITGRKS